MNLFRRKNLDKEKVEPSLQEQREAYIKRSQNAYLENVAKSLAAKQERNLNAPLPKLPIPLDELREARLRREANERAERENWRRRGSTTGNVHGPRGNSDLPHPNRRSTDTDHTLSTLLILNSASSHGSEPSRSSHCEPSRSYESHSRDSGCYDSSSSDSGGSDSGGGD